VLGVLLLAWIGCARLGGGGDDPRYVSLSPAITDAVVALGATDALVGRSDWCTADEVAGLPALGSALTPSLEGVVAVHPSGILVERDGGAAVEALGGIAPVHALPWLTVDQVAASTEALGALLDRAGAAEALASRVRALDVPPPPGAPRVLLVIGTDGPEGEVWFVKRDSLHGRALHAAGYRNAIDEAVAGAPSITAERIVKLDPDAIVMLDAAPLPPEAERAAVARWSALAPLRAVRDGRVSVLSEPGVLSVGPTVADLPERLRRHLAR
jgi:ABC-type Fe3+-hydroxamate transport system substrate-binding protein